MTDDKIPSITPEKLDKFVKLYKRHLKEGYSAHDSLLGTYLRVEKVSQGLVPLNEVLRGIDQYAQVCEDFGVNNPLLDVFVSRVSKAIYPSMVGLVAAAHVALISKMHEDQELPEVQEISEELKQAIAVASGQVLQGILLDPLVSEAAVLLRQWLGALEAEEKEDEEGGDVL